MPVPKNRAQTRLTAARAKYGFSGAVTQSASSSRPDARRPHWGLLAVEERGLDDLVRVGDRQLAAVGDLADRRRRPRPFPASRRRRRTRPGPRTPRASSGRTDGCGTGRTRAGCPGTSAPCRRRGSRAWRPWRRSRPAATARRGDRGRCLPGAPGRPGGPSGPRGRSGRSRRPRRFSCGATPRRSASARAIWPSVSASGKSSAR